MSVWDEDTRPLPKVMLASGKGRAAELTTDLDPLGRIADLFTAASVAPPGLRVGAFREALKAYEKYLLRRLVREVEGG